MQTTVNNNFIKGTDAKTKDNQRAEKFQWVEVAHREENGNWIRHFTHEDKVDEFLKEYPKDSYQSVYRFNSGDKGVVLQARQAKEQPIMGSLFIDFDPPKDVSLEDGLSVVLKDARSFLDTLKGLMNGIPEGVSTFFSGRGIHIEIDYRLFSANPDTKANIAYKLLVEEISSRALQHLETLDMKIFDNGRLKRIENSINSRSGLYKTRLSLEEFKSASPEEILEIAEKQRVRVEKSASLEPNSGAAELFHACLEAAHEARTILNPDVVEPWLELQLDKSSFRDLIENPIPPIPTFSEQLNRLFNGGLKPGKFYNLVAQAGGGKTTFAWQLAHELAANKTHVLYVSMEMSMGELLTKSISRLAKVDAGLIESGSWREQEEISVSNGNLPSVGQRLEDAWIHIRDLKPYLYLWQAFNGGTIEALERYLQRFREKFEDHPLVVVIDPYQRLINGVDRSGDETFRTGQLAQKLKDMTLEYQMALFALSDTNKESHRNNTWDHTALRGSYESAHLSDAIIGLRTSDNLKTLLGDDTNKWPIVPLPKSSVQAPSDPVYACLEIFKNRTGRLGKIPFVFERAYCKFSPLPQPRAVQVSNSKGKNGQKGRKSKASKPAKKG